MSKSTGWTKIKKFTDDNDVVPRRVDLWLHIYASPRSMGISDSFRVVDAYREKGKWLHSHDGKPTELFEDYITHFMERPPGPDGQVDY